MGLNLVRRKSDKQFLMAGFSDFTGQFNLAVYEQVEIQEDDAREQFLVAKGHATQAASIEDLGAKWRERQALIPPGPLADLLAVIGRANGWE